MRTRFVFWAIAVLNCVWTCLSGAAEVQFKDLARHVPDSANTLVLVNVKKLLDSPISQKESWRKDPMKRFTAGLTSIPADASQLIVAAQHNLEDMRPLWEIGLIHVDSPPTSTTLARQYGGVIDTVAGLPSVRLSDDSYVVQLADGLLGGFAPANRQTISRWIRKSDGNLSPYLQEAISYATAGTEIILAVDLADVAAVEDIRQGIEAFDNEILRNANIDTKELAELLASAKGLMLGMTFGDRAFGKMKVDFGRDASMLSGIAKPVLLAILAHRGMMLDEFEDWKAEVEGQRVMFGGYLTSSGLTRLSSLVQLPTSAFHNLREVQQAAEAIDVEDTDPNTALHGAAGHAAEIIQRNAPPAPKTIPPQLTPAADAVRETVPHAAEMTQGQEIPSPGTVPPGVPQLDEAIRDPSRQPEIAGASQMIGQATRQYFLSVQHLRADLYGRKREARTPGQIGMWYDGYARRIDRLPMLNTDDQMLDYGAYVATQFRNASMAIKGVGIRSRVQEVTAVNQGVSETIMGTSYRRGFNLREEQTVRTQVRTVKKAQIASSVQQIELEIENATAKIRRVMTQKYQIQF